ncbi:unnamed protein product [Meganyctiphanes norvegica]|uniref:BHLH domain-containing protein n=1 Tax=Meganyctiphanes norvegica TaxID=48144 RepID=A0AAV2RZT0_MEGNR
MKPPVGGTSKGGALRDRDILRSQNTRTLKPDNPTNSQVNLVQCGASSTPPTGSSLDTSESPSTSEGNSSSPEGGGGGDSGGGKGAEMRMYLEKLREMVPYAPSSGRINKVELIHSAIDYISDLQEALEARARRKLREKGAMQPPRPPLASLPTAAHATTPNTTPLHENGSNRPPTQLEVNTSHPDIIASPFSSASSTTTNSVLVNRTPSSSSTSTNLATNRNTRTPSPFSSSSFMNQILTNRTTRSPMSHPGVNSMLSSSSSSTNTSQVLTNSSTSSINRNISVIQDLDVSNEESFQRTLASVMSLSAPSNNRTRTPISHSESNVNDDST